MRSHSIVIIHNAVSMCGLLLCCESSGNCHHAAQTTFYPVVIPFNRAFFYQLVNISRDLTLSGYSASLESLNLNIFSL